MMILSRLLRPSRQALPNALFLRRYSGRDPGLKDESGGPEFQRYWIEHFQTCPDAFELQRGLNNSFAYDVVPPIPVLEAALRACRRLNEPAVAIRVFGFLKGKTDNDKQYDMYVNYLRPLMDELGVSTPEEIGRFDNAL